MPSLDRWLLLPESPVFWSLTFAPLTSNVPRPNCFFPFHCSQLLCPVNPYLTRGLTDDAQGKAVKLATGKRTALMKVKQVTVCSLPSLPSRSASALPNADVFITLIFPPAVMPPRGIICLCDISLGRHTHANFASFTSGVHTSSSRSCK